LKSIKIMPLGDSITAGFSDGDSTQEFITGGYRGPLRQMLIEARYGVDFVGSKNDGAPREDPQHEGHSGMTAALIAERIFKFLDDHPAEIVMLHIGTNNIIVGNPVSQIIKEITQILDQIDRYEAFSHTTITVVLAKIVNRFDNRGAPGLITAKLNESIGEMANARIAAGDSLLVADFEHALSYPADISSCNPPSVCVHPNATGYAKMAKVWFDALTSSPQVLGRGGHFAQGQNFILPSQETGGGQGQPGWRFCGNCGGLFWDGDPNFKGVCVNGRGQPNWRFCGKCGGLFWNGDPKFKGVCPKGQTHSAIGWHFILPSVETGGGGGQPDWAFCGNCGGLFWNGDPKFKGVCPKGQTHSAIGWHFILPSVETGGGQGQMEWRFCGKCGGLFWNGDPKLKGVCPGFP
jgi:lysophospholipase L1-like esterase